MNDLEPERLGALLGKKNVAVEDWLSIEIISAHEDTVSRQLCTDARAFATLVCYIEDPVDAQNPLEGEHI